jgi:hypothetical protein
MRKIVMGQALLLLSINQEYQKVQSTNQCFDKIVWISWKGLCRRFNGAEVVRIDGVHGHYRHKWKLGTSRDKELNFHRNAQQLELWMLPAYSDSRLSKREVQGEEQNVCKFKSSVLRAFHETQHQELLSTQRTQSDLRNTVTHKV